jgi:hypothetical protein
MRVKRQRVQVYLLPKEAQALAAHAEPSHSTMSKLARKAVIAWLRAEGLPEASERPAGDEQEEEGPKVRRVGVRVSERLFARLTAAAQDFGQTPAGWASSLLAHALDGDPLTRHDERIALERLSEELAAIGNNLNQIARALNVDVKLTGVADAARLDVALIRRCLELVEATASTVTGVLDASRQTYRRRINLAANERTVAT